MCRVPLLLLLLLLQACCWLMLLGGARSTAAGCQDKQHLGTWIHTHRDGTWIQVWPAFSTWWWCCWPTLVMRAGRLSTASNNGRGEGAAAAAASDTPLRAGSPRARAYPHTPCSLPPLFMLV